MTLLFWDRRAWKWSRRAVCLFVLSFETIWEHTYVTSFFHVDTDRHLTGTFERNCEVEYASIISVLERKREWMDKRPEMGQDSNTEVGVSPPAERAR